jgi:hypothetical protein
LSAPGAAHTGKTPCINPGQNRVQTKREFTLDSYVVTQPLRVVNQRSSEAFKTQPVNKQKIEYRRIADDYSGKVKE